MATLPPEMGAELERIFGKAAASKDGAWIADYAGFEESVSHGISVSRVHVKNSDMAGLLSKEIGHYTTLKTGPLNEYEQFENICRCLTEELRPYLAPYTGKSLCVCGLGNPELLHDALGPETAKRIYPKVPMQSSFKNVTVFCPNVTGTTNISTAAAISGIISATGAACVLAIDAMECTNYGDMGNYIALTDAGLQVGRNDREPLNQSTIGVPIVAIGVPTSIRTENLGIKVPCDDLLTIAGISTVVRYASSMIACAVLPLIYPEMDYEDSKEIVDTLMLY